MKIAVASSGLGHVSRGIETWARDLAAALARRHVEVTLFAADVLPGLDAVDVRILSCLHRGSDKARWLAVHFPTWFWRWGFRSEYGWEQFSFWWRLWPVLRKERFDILHVQDPMLAVWCRKFRRMGLVRTKEILAHGTEEPAEFLGQFDYVQHLAPWHLTTIVRGPSLVHAQPSTRRWVAIPNFVDTDLFCPLAKEASASRRDLRVEIGIPVNAFVIGCVAAVKKHHKRIDYLIREFISCSRRCAALGGRPFLLIAGAREKDSEELIQEAERLVPGKVKVLLDWPRARMPDLYRSMDIFVLGSLFEMMPIAILEALASGVPVVANRHPVLEWMVGDEETAADGRLRRGTDGTGALSVAEESKGGACIDMAKEGALAELLAEIAPEWIAQRSKRARERALAMFSQEVVVGRITDYYRTVMDSGRREWQGDEQAVKDK